MKGGGGQNTQGREEQTDITNQEASSRLDLVRRIENWGSKGTQLVSMLNQAALLAKNKDNREEQKRVAKNSAAETNARPIWQLYWVSSHFPIKGINKQGQTSMERKQCIKC